MSRAPTPRRPFTLMIISNAADRVHMALMTAATAAAMGRPVTLFFSKKAAPAVKRGGFDALPAPDGGRAADMNHVQTEKGIADAHVLLDALAALDAWFLVCETALREEDIDPADLMTRPPVEVAGLATILERGAGGDWLTF